MIINRYQIGAGKRRRNVYGVCNDAAETGDQLREIARFDSLELAVIVMRYIRGDSMTQADEIQAREALQKVAAPAVESIEGSH